MIEPVSEKSIIDICAKKQVHLHVAVKGEGHRSVRIETTSKDGINKMQRYFCTCGFMLNIYEEDFQKMIREKGFINNRAEL